MKSGQLFWGLFFIALGVLYFTSEYNLIIYNWEFIWNFWAVVFIFWGLQLLTKNTSGRLIVDGVFGIVLAILIFGSISNTFNGGFNSDDDENYQSSVFSSEMDTSYVFGDLEINGGAGVFLLNKVTDNLIVGTSEGDFGNYSFNENKDGDRVNLVINQEGENINHISGNFNNKLTIALNPDPIWNISLNVGAAKNRIDLSKFKVRKINLKAGVTNSKIKLGDRFEQTELNVEMGVSSLNLLIPKESGCKITGEMALMIKNLDDFTKSGDGNYYTSNYETSKNRIDININSGVSKLTIDTY